MSTTSYLPPVHTVRGILKYTYGIIPIVAGADKFTNLLAHWTDYLRGVESYLPIAPSNFMMIVGVIEIIAGLIVFSYTRIGAIIVTLWLLAIAIVLLAGGFYDIAVRDIAMAIGAFCLFKLYDRKVVALK